MVKPVVFILPMIWPALLVLSVRAGRYSGTGYHRAAYGQGQTGDGGESHDVGSASRVLVTVCAILERIDARRRVDASAVVIASEETTLGLAVDFEVLKDACE